MGLASSTRQKIEKQNELTVGFLFQEQQNPCVTFEGKNSIASEFGTWFM